MADAPKPAASAPEPVVPPPAPAAPLPTPDPAATPAPESDEVKALREKAAKADDLQFEVDLTKIAQTYPKAPEFSAKIKEKVAKGYSATDAALIVLHENNALQAQPAPAPRPTGGFGGSMDTPPPRDTKDPVPGAPGSAEFYANRFKELEANGEIRID